MSIHEDFNAIMMKMKSANPKLQLPPKSFTETKSEVVGYDEKSLSIRFPFDERFTNPLGMFQGGMLCTLLDNVYGPLSYMAAQTGTITLDMNCTYIRPFLPDSKYVTIKATVVSKSKQLIRMQATVEDAAGKLVATSTTQSLILSA